jgi:hypothetical protein
MRGMDAKMARIHSLFVSAVLLKELVGPKSDKLLEQRAPRV